MSKFELTNQAYEIYLELQNKISEMYIKSEEYPIFQKSTEEVLLYDTEEYIHELFTNITAQGRIKYEEKEFIDKLKTIDVEPEKESNAGKLIESVVTSIPEYLKLAKEVDGYTQNTRYADELLECTERICQLLQEVDGVIDKKEIGFTNPVMENLKNFVRK